MLILQKKLYLCIRKKKGKTICFYQNQLNDKQ